MGLAKARIVIVNENQATANKVEKDKNATATTATTATNDKSKDKDKKIENEKYIEVMFNPSSLKIRSATKYADTKAYNVNFGATEAMKQFLQVETEVLTVDLFFDTTRDGAKAKPVREKIMPLLKLARAPDGATDNTPPKLKFAWGDLVFHCFITSIEQTYDCFNSSGQALRATLNITFLGYDENWKKADKSADTTTNTTPANPATKEEGVKIQDGENPPQASTRLTGEPTNWKPICDANGIINPLNNSEIARA